LRQGEEPPGDFEILIRNGGVVEKKKEAPSLLDGTGPRKGKGTGWGRVRRGLEYSPLNL